MSVAQPLSVSAYTPVSRLCKMNPRTAMDCIALATIPTAAWSKSFLLRADEVIE